MNDIIVYLCNAIGRAEKAAERVRNNQYEELK